MTDYLVTDPEKYRIVEKNEFSITCPHAPHLRLYVNVRNIEKHVLIAELEQLLHAIRRHQ